MRDLLAFGVFLVALLAAMVLVVIWGSINYDAIWFFTGWKPNTTIWVTIGGFACFVIMGIMLVNANLERAAMCAFLMAALSAATGMGAIGPRTVIGRFFTDYEVTNYAIWVGVELMLILGCLIGAFMNSGFALKPLQPTE